MAPEINRTRRWSGRGPLQSLLIALIVTFASLAITSPAAAHSELGQSSPEAGETVGGEFHSIALQFFGLDDNAFQEAHLFDPAGQLISSALPSENQRLVIPIEPLEVPGEYTISYIVTGLDGDITSESFTFRYSPDAPEPKGITIEFSSGEPGFDFVGYALLLVGAAIAAFLVQRFWSALKEHRAYQADQASRQ